MGRYLRRLLHLPDVLAAGLLLVIVVIGLLQVFYRDVLNSSLVWSEELNRVLFLWMIFLAAIRAGHMRILVLVNRFPQPLAVAAHLLTLAVSLAMFWILIRYGVNVAKIQASDRYIGIAISKDVPYYALFIASALWALACCAGFIADLRRRPNGPERGDVP